MKQIIWTAEMKFNDEMILAVMFAMFAISEKKFRTSTPLFRNCINCKHHLEYVHIFRLNGHRKRTFSEIVSRVDKFVKE